jgi:predicted dehydrogenase
VQTVRFCVIGAGRAGLLHARNLSRRIPAARLVALCDANRDALEQAGEELGVKTLFSDYPDACASPDINAVVIVVPTFLHCDVACLAAGNGKHVVLEKPMALSVEECRTINSAVKSAGVKLQIGFMRRFDEGFLRAKEILDSGEMGQVMIIKSTGRGPGGPGPWMYDLRKSNGIVAEVNSHDIDSLFWFTAGQPLKRVYAQGHNFKCPDARQQWPDFYDNVVANFTFADGTMGVIDGTCPAHYGYDARVEILCEKGVLFIGDYQQRTTVRVTVDGNVMGSAVKSWRNLFKDAYLAEMEHFVDCVVKDKPPRVTGDDGVRAVEAVVAINRSIRSGQVVEMSPRADGEARA